MSLTPEQQQALDELIRLVPKGQTAQARHQPGWLKTWFGLSAGDVKSILQVMAAQKDGYEKKLLDWIEKHPLDATFEWIGIAAWIFYQAEKGVNTGVNTYIDALFYIASCATEGETEITALTQAGRAIASLMMIVGPALTQRTLDRPKTVSNQT